jgi:energy-coupling factor transporter transmembrane protein EcfT
VIYLESETVETYKHKMKRHNSEYAVIVSLTVVIFLYIFANHALLYQNFERGFSLNKDNNTWVFYLDIGMLTSRATYICIYLYFSIFIVLSSLRFYLMKKYSLSNSEIVHISKQNCCFNKSSKPALNALILVSITS